MGKDAVLLVFSLFSPEFLEPKACSTAQASLDNGIAWLLGPPKFGPIPPENSHRH